MNLVDFIKVYQILTEEECDFILKEIENNEYYRATTAKLGEKDLTPKVDNFRTNSQTVINYNSPADNLIYERVSLCYAKWQESLPDELYKKMWGNHFTNIKDTGYEVNRYNESEYYDITIDELPCKEIDRVVSFVLYLNDDFKGGDLVFPFCKFTPQKGYAIIFPSNWMYPHKSEPIIEGTKYSVVTWFVNQLDEEQTALKSRNDFKLALVESSPICP